MSVFTIHRLGFFQPSFVLFPESNDHLVMLFLLMEIESGDEHFFSGLGISSLLEGSMSSGLSKFLLGKGHVVFCEFHVSNSNGVLLSEDSKLFLS